MMMLETGSLKTHGELLGENQDSSDLKPEILAMFALN
jgi:hypothetical protein